MKKWQSRAGLATFPDAAPVLWVEMMVLRQYGVAAVWLAFVLWLIGFLAVANWAEPKRVWHPDLWFETPQGPFDQQDIRSVRLPSVRP